MDECWLLFTASTKFKWMLDLKFEISTSTMFTVLAS